MVGVLDQVLHDSWQRGLLQEKACEVQIGQLLVFDDAQQHTAQHVGLWPRGLLEQRDS